jgi:uncharacterized membrane protein
MSRREYSLREWSAAVGRVVSLLAACFVLWFLVTLVVVAWG